VRRTGIAAALGVLYVALVQSLLHSGRIDFAVRVDCAVPGRLPRAEVCDTPPSPVCAVHGTLSPYAAQGWCAVADVQCLRGLGHVAEQVAVRHCGGWADCGDCCLRHRCCTFRGR
jgi:hypothetical protein